jgi:hypothetical protein
MLNSTCKVCPVWARPEKAKPDRIKRVVAAFRRNLLRMDASGSCRIPGASLPEI